MTKVIPFVLVPVLLLGAQSLQAQEQKPAAAKTKQEGCGPRLPWIPTASIEMALHMVRIDSVTKRIGAPVKVDPSEMKFHVDTVLMKYSTINVDGELIGISAPNERPVTEFPKVGTCPKPPGPPPKSK